MQSVYSATLADWATKIMELALLENIHLIHYYIYFSYYHYYLAVNKLIIDTTQNIYLIAEHSGFIKYTLNKLDLMI